MELGNLLDMLIGLIIVGGGYWCNMVSKEQKRLEILLNKTREEYATRLELRDTTDRLIECLHRVEDKLDRILSK